MSIDFLKKFRLFSGKDRGIFECPYGNFFDSML